MAIQFQCISCGKPMEVDDQWARQLVECPHCHDTVTAPAYSSYQVAESVDAGASINAGASGEHPPTLGETPGPMAAPPSSVPSWGASPHAATARPAGSPTVAIVALVLASLSLVGMVATGAVLGQQMIAEGLVNQPPEEVQRAFEQAAEEGASWIGQVAILMLGSCVVWLAAVVLGLIGVLRPAGRGYAIAALVIAGLPMALMVVASVVGGL